MQRTKVEVSLTRDNSDLVLTIGDNGEALPKPRCFILRRLGLLGMRERVNLLAAN